MIAKLIVHGPTRAVALAQLRRGLAETQVAGTVTNLAFLGGLAAHPGFAAGDFDTGLIGRDIEALTVVPEPAVRHRVAAAMVAMGLDTPTPDAGFALWEPLRQRVGLTCQGEAFEAQVEVLGANQQRWTLGDDIVMATRTAGDWQIDGSPMPKTHVTETEVTVFDRFGLVFGRLDSLTQSTEHAGDGNVIEAPMPGLVKTIAAQAGASVRKGDRLAVLEAMKMEHALLAARDGTVAEVLATEGEQVAAGAALIRLASEDDT